MTSVLARFSLSAGMLRQVRQELVLLQQRDVVDLAAVILRVGAEDGIARRGHQRDVAGIDEARRAGSTGPPWSRSSGRPASRDRCRRRRRRSSSTGPRPACTARRRCRRSRGCPVAARPCAAPRRTSGNAISSGSPTPMSISSAPGCAARRGALGALDLLELVNLGALAVHPPADAVGEEVLDVRIAHGDSGLSVIFSSCSFVPFVDNSLLRGLRVSAVNLLDAERYRLCSTEIG